MHNRSSCRGRLAHRQRLLPWLLISLALILAGGTFAVAEIPNPFPANEITVLPPLPNGLRIIVREDHSFPVVAMEVVVRGGAAAETQETGVAHLLEHVSFQGTRDYPNPLEAQWRLETVGGLSNANTTHDTTRFQAAVAAEHADTLITTLAEVTLHSTLSAAACENEKATVDAEIASRLADPVEALLTRAGQLTYQNHPYHDPAMGTQQAVDAILPARVRAFHDRWYVPNNMSVVLAGDITAARALALVRSAFGAVEAKPLPPLPKDEPAGTGAMLVRHYPTAIPDTYQALVFPTPASADAPTLVSMDLLLTLLADGQDALLPDQWRANGVVVKQFGIEYVGSRAPGRFMIWMDTAPEAAQAARDATIAYMKQLAADPVAPEVWRNAQQRLAARFLRENETYTQQASTLAFYEGLGDARLAGEYLPAVERMTPEQFRTFVPTHCLAWITLGKEPK